MSDTTPITKDDPPPITDDELALIVAAHEAATPGPWFTVEAPWRANYYNRETESHESIPTYIIAGSDDPHAGKPVLDAVHIEEWETEEQKAAFVSQTDSDLGFCCIARSAIPRLVREVIRLRAERAEVMNSQKPDAVQHVANEIVRRPEEKA